MIDETAVQNLEGSIGDVGPLVDVIRCKQHPDVILSGNSRIEAAKRLGKALNLKDYEKTIKIKDYDVQKKAQEKGYSHEVMEELVRIHANTQRQVGEDERREEFNELAKRFHEKDKVPKTEVATKVVEALKFQWSKQWVLQHLDEEWKSPEKVAAGKVRGRQQAEEKIARTAGVAVAASVVEKAKEEGGIVTSPEPHAEQLGGMTTTPRTLSEIRKDVDRALTTLESKATVDSDTTFSQAEIDFAVADALATVAGDYILKTAKQILTRQGRQEAIKFVKDQLRYAGSSGPGHLAMQGTGDGIKLSRKVAGRGHIVSYTTIVDKYIIADPKIALLRPPTSIAEELKEWFAEAEKIAGSEDLEHAKTAFFALVAKVAALERKAGSA